MFIIIGVIIIFLLQYNNHFSSNKFIKETEPYFRTFMEDDYKFLLNIKYGDIDVQKMYGMRVRNAIAVFILCLFIFMSKLSFAYILLSLLIAFGMFKLPYIQLSNYYKQNLHKIVAG